MVALVTGCFVNIYGMVIYFFSDVTTSSFEAQWMHLKSLFAKTDKLLHNQNI